MLKTREQLLEKRRIDEGCRSESVYIGEISDVTWGLDVLVFHATAI